MRANNRFSVVVALGLAIGAATGCTSSSPPGEGTPSPTGNTSGAGRFQPGLRFAESQANLAGAGGTAFNFGNLRELWVRIAVPSVTDVAGAEIRMINPFGESMYVARPTFVTDTTLTGVTTSAGYVPAFPARYEAGGYSLDHGIPVGGTILNRVPAPGIWEVQVQVEGCAQLLLGAVTISYSR